MLAVRWNLIALFTGKNTTLTCGFPLIVDTMIFRNVSILTSSDPFSRADRSSETEGYSAADSNTIVWHDTSDEDIVEVSDLLLTTKLLAAENRGKLTLISIRIPIPLTEGLLHAILLSKGAF